MEIIDANNLVFGRAASQIAKKLISGTDVQIINAEHFVLLGNSDQIVERYLTKRRLKNKADPEKSPKWPNVPHLFVKRMIKGMLPKKTSRGRDAEKRLMVFTGNPKSLKSNLKLEKAGFDGVSKHITIAELCKRIGYSG